MEILRIQNLYKSFGTNEVIKDLSFSVPEHSIFGFIGQNGAGKTTTMEMILGLLKPDRGNITIYGETVTYGQTRTNRFVGYLPDVPEFYNYMTPQEYLRLCGEITGMSPGDIKTKSEELLELVGLKKANKKIGGFSRGMKQRLGTAQALLNSPKLLICDEPTSALDPIGRKEILDILKQVREETTVLFSTHILSDAERICDKILVLHGGRSILSGVLREIKSQYKGDNLLIEFKSHRDMQKFIASDKIRPFLKGVEQNDATLIFQTQNISKLQLVMFEVFIDKDILPIGFEILEPTLENLFMEVVQ